MQRLPIELIYGIGQHLALRDQVSLQSSCRRAHAAMLPLVYRDVCLWYLEGEQSLENYNDILVSFAKNGQFIRTMKILVELSRPQNNTLPRPTIPDFPRLEAMTGLRSCQVQLKHPISWAPWLKGLRSIVELNHSLELLDLTIVSTPGNEPTTDDIRFSRLQLSEDHPKPLRRLVITTIDARQIVHSIHDPFLLYNELFKGALTNLSDLKHNLQNEAVEAEPTYSLTNIFRTGLQKSAKYAAHRPQKEGGGTVTTISTVPRIEVLSTWDVPNLRHLRFGHPVSITVLDSFTRASLQKIETLEVVLRPWYTIAGLEDISARIHHLPNLKFLIIHDPDTALADRELVNQARRRDFWVTNTRPVFNEHPKLMNMKICCLDPTPRGLQNRYVEILITRDSATLPTLELTYLPMSYSTLW